MDLLDRLLGHDAWTTGQLLLKCRGLSDEQLDREHDIGHRTIRATFLHLIRNMEIWTDLIAGRQIRPNVGDAESRSVDGMMRRLEAVAPEFAAIAHEVAEADGWDDLWTDTMDDPPTRKSYGGAIAHVITHSMHHRAQLLYLLRLTGIDDLIEGDVLSWESQAIGGV